MASSSLSLQQSQLSQPPLSFPVPDHSCLGALHHWEKPHWKPALLTPLHRTRSLARGSLLHLCRASTRSKAAGSLINTKPHRTMQA